MRCRCHSSKISKLRGALSNELRVRARTYPTICARELTLSAAGYKALFVSVDLPVIGSRRNEQRNKWAFPSHIEFPSLQGATDDLMATYAAGYGRLSCTFG